FTGGVACHVFPRSLVRSKCTRQPPSPSVLDGQRISPFASCTGLFLIGPSMPSGNRVGLAQVLPASSDVVIIPHQAAGLGPTLYNSSSGPDFGWNKTGFQHGKRLVANPTPSATSTGAVQRPFSI